MTPFGHREPNPFRNIFPLRRCMAKVLLCGRGELAMSSVFCLRILSCLAIAADGSLLLAAERTHAQLAPEWNYCDDKGLGTPDVRIRNCTMLIESSGENAKNRAVAYTNRGHLYRDKGDLDHAVADYSQAITLDPKLVPAYNARSRVYHVKGDLEHAMVDYNQAITLDPKNVLAHNNRGLVYGAKGDLEHAIADFNQVTTLDPTNAQAYNFRGRAYQDKGDLEHAMADYNPAIKLDPKYAQAYINRGHVYQVKGDTAHAAADNERAIALEASPWRNSTFLHGQDPERTLRIFERAGI